MEENTIKKALHSAAQNTIIVFWAVLLLLLFMDIISGIYLISPNELGVIQRFGKIQETYGEVELKGRYTVTCKFRIHKLSLNSGDRVGVEIAMQKMGVSQKIPLILTKGDTMRLVQLLNRAVSHS